MKATSLGITFSFLPSISSSKTFDKNVSETWKTMFYNVIGRSISNNKAFSKSVNGITISPKKNFCIIKVWLNSCQYQNPDFIKVRNLNFLFN